MSMQTPPPSASRRQAATDPPGVRTSKFPMRKLRDKRTEDLHQCSTQILLEHLTERPLRQERREAILTELKTRGKTLQIVDQKLLPVLSKAFPHLAYLTLSTPGLRAALDEEPLHLPALQSLKIVEGEDYDLELIPVLGRLNCPNLTKLEIVAITDQFELLNYGSPRELPPIASLFLDMLASKEDYQVLAGLTTLREIYLTGEAFDETAISLFASLPLLIKLVILEFPEEPLPPEEFLQALKAIGTLKQLKCLEIGPLPVKLQKLVAETLTGITIKFIDKQERERVSLYFATV